MEIQASRQAEAKEQAEELGLSLSGQRSARVEITEYIERAEHERERLLDQSREARTSVADCQRTLNSARARQKDLSGREPIWRDLATRAQHLADELERSLVSLPELQAARQLVAQRVVRIRAKESEFIERRESLQSEARELLAAGGPFDPELMQLKDCLGAELLAGAFEDASLQHDGSIRLRPPAGLSARTANGVVDLSGIAEVLGEVSIPERALLDGLAFDGTIRAVLLVENLGAWRDLPPPPRWLLAHVPGWDTATVGHLLDRIEGIPVVHFGDVDPNGVRIMQHLRWRAPNLKWFLPEFWFELADACGLRAMWPQDLDLDFAPAQVRALAARGLWLSRSASSSTRAWQMLLNWPWLSNLSDPAFSHPFSSSALNR